MNGGKLYIVPTPIGNLGDMTVRGIATLKQVDVILAEDTRTTKKLLDFYAISQPMQSYHLHNEHKVLNSVVERMVEGTVMALVSDAGSPTISDPGFLLIRACINRGIVVEVLPGATAFVPALSLSALPAERFCFEGFLPDKKGRTKRLQALSTEERTMIFYVSPHKIEKTLIQFVEIFGNERKASLSREITKKFEETVRLSLSELLEHMKNHPPKGEIVLVVEGMKNKRGNAHDKGF